MEIRVDQEFETKIPPLTDDEFRILEESILAAGEIYSPIIIWDGTIIDGHNRYRILKKHPELKYSVKEISFEDREDAMAWICENQLGRRNLSPMQRKYLIGVQYRLQKHSHGGCRKSTADSSDKNDHLKNETTRQKLAREHGVSEAYIQHCADYADGIDIAESVKPGIGKLITGGKIKLTQGHVEQITKIPEKDRTEYIENTVEEASAAGSKRRKLSCKVSGQTKELLPGDTVAAVFQRSLEKFLDTWEKMFEENEDWVSDHKAFCVYMIGSCGLALEKFSDECLWDFFEDDN